MGRIINGRTGAFGVVEDGEITHFAKQSAGGDARGGVAGVATSCRRVQGEGHSLLRGVGG